MRGKNYKVFGKNDYGMVKSIVFYKTADGKLYLSTGGSDILLTQEQAKELSNKLAECVYS